MRILIIEDDRATARLYSDWLAKAGHDIRVVGTGSDALANVVSWKPEGVLLDLILPDMPGMEVLFHIRRQMPDVRVIACTNGFIPALVETAIANGAAHVFDKSILSAQDLALKFDEIARR